MADRYDLKVMRKGRDGKDYGTKIGAAWPWKSGKDGFNLTFDALPIAQMRDDGTLSCDVMMAEPYKDDKISAHNKAKADGYQPEPQAKMETLDDEVPF